MGHEEPSDFCGGGSFEVLGETAASAEPGESAFDDPTPRQKLEAFDAMRSLNDLDCPRPAVRECGQELIALVHPVGKDLTELGEAVPQPLQQRNGSVAILNVGRVNVDGEQKSIGVGYDMTLAPVNTLAGIVASRSSCLGRRCALTVDDRRCRTGLAREVPAGLSNQRCDDFLPSPAIAPRIKIALDRRIRRKFLRQSAPLATGRQNVKIACKTARKSTSRGRPNRRRGGSRRAISAHSASVMSLA